MVQWLLGRGLTRWYPSFLELANSVQVYEWAYSAGLQVDFPRVLRCALSSGREGVVDWAVSTPEGTEAMSGLQLDEQEAEDFLWCRAELKSLRLVNSVMTLAADLARQPCAALLPSVSHTMLKYAVREQNLSVCKYLCMRLGVVPGAKHLKKAAELNGLY